MGNATSSRRVTVVNDDVVGVVQVSEDVVRRLMTDPDKLSDSVKPSAKEPKLTPEVPQPPPASGFVPYSPIEPYSSTLEQRQKYHEEYKKAERSWQNRIMELESQNRLLLNTTKDKFSVVLTDIEENHMKNSYAPVCPDKQLDILKCLKENAKYPLQCSREVNDFMECVEKVRVTALSS